MQALGARQIWHAHGNERLRASASHARGSASSGVAGFFANAFLSFAPFSYTRALESLTAVVPRLDRGSASFRPRLRLVSTAVHTRRYCSQNANTYTLSLICTVHDCVVVFVLLNCDL